MKNVDLVKILRTMEAECEIYISVAGERKSAKLIEKDVKGITITDGRKIKTKNTRKAK